MVIALSNNYFAGVNIGTVSIAFVLLDEKGDIFYKDYRFHKGNIHSVLIEMLNDVPVKQVNNFGVVAEKGREFFSQGVEVNEQVAIIKGVNHLSPGCRSIITIGGERFGLILFDNDGHYRKFISNSVCAAGTGSFLDQQASRLGISGAGELSDIAASYTSEPPKIATRCAVFAKTDLTHIQQQGYGLPAIAAGLCRGVAQNIYDTLFQGTACLNPIVVVGGVSKNRKVVEYLEKLVKHPFIPIPDSEYVGAVGAALVSFPAIGTDNSPPFIPLNSILRDHFIEKSYYYLPLSQGGKSDLPDFASLMSLTREGVEIDIYSPLVKDTRINCFIGFDIGSTSTKAIIMTQGDEVLLGLYTRTEGQPIKAIQRLTKTLEGIEKEYGVNFNILSAGTTGSGRKFIQRIISADYAADEITAHARAAYHLNPKVDTIIEIGGQDAKFTVLKNGNIIFSLMNYVCAAGTGSFIEEQAKRLNVPLSEYSNLAVDSPAPLISNRCTVFMERDLNHHLSMGYSKKELLASVLHSVRDNYLSKVAHQDKIGECIAFQGATAKNQALVRAFEQTLKKPIYVSKYCHLTGALGVCLKMSDCLNIKGSHFRKKLHNEMLEVHEYVCEYCNNNCKIKKIDVDGETLGWGYLCGREERDSGFRKREESGFNVMKEHRNVFKISKTAISEKTGEHFHLFREFQKGGISAVIRKSNLSLSRLKNRIQFNALELRDEIFSSGIIARKEETDPAGQITIGLPSTLNMLEYLPLWELFFKHLGFKTITTSSNKPYIQYGKKIIGAEYCSPLTEFHGHIKELSDKVDYIFYPQLFENDLKDEKRSYCYYSNYAVPIIKNIPDFHIEEKMISPFLTMNEDVSELVRELYVRFPERIRLKTSFHNVEEAFYMAWDWYRERKSDLLEIFKNQVGATNDISIALIGRPYLILNRSLNKGIPDKLTEKGIQSFYMDMIPIDEERLDAAKDFIEWNHWYYGNSIIKASEMVAIKPNIFPIYMTAFKCSPDSFIISYFKKIMDYYKKPYLILQLDEHEGLEGYDTRLEAAIETFRGYKETPVGEKIKPRIRLKKIFENKTYILPNYDPLSARFIQAVFEREGIAAVIMEQDQDSFRKSSQSNDGQCLPVSVLTHGIIYTMGKYNLKPDETAFYSNTECLVSCNLPQYPVMIKQMLEKMGGGMEKIDILVKNLFPSDMPLDFMYEIAMAYLFSGVIQKITRKIRPREKRKGETDIFYRYAEKNLYNSFRQGKNKEECLQEIINTFLTIEIKDIHLPKVGIVGDLYVRDSELFNQNLIKEIEEYGIEVVSIPFIDAMILYAGKYFQGMWDAGQYIYFFGSKVAFNTINKRYNRLLEIAYPILKSGIPGLKNNPIDYLNRYGFTSMHGGETIENFLKVYYLHENHKDLKFIINVNPIFCCPGLISEAIYKRLEKDIKIPIISITYDGTESNKNNILKPYLHYIF